MAAASITPGIWRGITTAALSLALGRAGQAQRVEPIAPPSLGSVGTVTASPGGVVAPIDSTAGAGQAVVTQSAALRAATVGPLIERMRAHTLSPQEAWQKGALDVDDLLYIVNERFDTWGGFNWHGDVELRRGLVKLLAENGGEKIKDFAKLPIKVRLWLADYYGSIGDEKVLGLAESVIVEIKPGAVGQEDLAFQAVERLGWFYRDRGEHEKSAQVWLRLKPMLATAGWQAPDSMIEAARAYEAAGQKSQSKATYDQIIAGDNEDFANGALWEYGSQLIRQSQIDKAQQLLLQVEAKSAKPLGKNGIMTAALLGYGHYLKGEWKEARRNYELCLARGAQLTASQRNSVRDITASARKMLGLIGQWEANPLVSDPERIDIAVGSESKNEPLTRRFLVSMFREVPLTVSSSNAQLQFRVEDSPWVADSQPLQFEKQVVVSIPSALLGQDTTAEIVVSSPQFPKYLLRIPLKITKAHE